MTQKRKVEGEIIEIKEFTKTEIDVGISKLNKRINDVKSIDSKNTKHSDATIETIELNIRETIREIFGTNSPEFKKHQYHAIWHGGVAFNLPDYERHRRFVDGIPQTISMLEGLIERLKEKEEYISFESKDKEISFWDLLHPSVITNAKSRFESKHYADAVETILKDLNNKIKDVVKKKTGKELDGSDLMHKAFSPNNPIITLDDLSTETGKNIQQGYMEIFAGAMTAIRNPKAHEIVNITKERAIHFLFFASLLYSKFDERI
ncbi:MAG: TIGR02391 family protein [Elusimicrobia bacterium]|nr:TIGR02391 family protein [Candidatus Liberimonas magnetica]